MVVIDQKWSDGMILWVEGLSVVLLIVASDLLESLCLHHFLSVIPPILFMLSDQLNELIVFFFRPLGSLLVRGSDSRKWFQLLSECSIVWLGIVMDQHVPAWNDLLYWFSVSDVIRDFQPVCSIQIDSLFKPSLFFRIPHVVSLLEHVGSWNDIALLSLKSDLWRWLYERRVAVIIWVSLRHLFRIARLYFWFNSSSLLLLIRCFK